ncbi:unnamed protein product [Closterium sp. Yama58-4]|nr:unnamed protein product [Closterium sp. Yama58-4]
MASPWSYRAGAGRYSLVPALMLLVMYSFASQHQPRATAFSLRVASPFRTRTHEEDDRSASPAIARRKLASSLPCTNSSLFGYAYAVQLGDGYARRVVESHHRFPPFCCPSHVSPFIPPSSLPLPFLFVLHPLLPPFPPSPLPPPVSFCTGNPSLILHWKPQVGRVTDMALQAVALSGAQKGWISVGWSGDGPILILHWKPQVGRVTDMALQAVALSGAQKGWISVGWSGDGRMSRSDAVVGNVAGYPSNIVALYLAGRNFADVKPAGYDLGRTVLEQGSTGSFVIKFSRRVDDGTVRFDPTGANTLIWAYSADPGSTELGFHGGNKGSALVDFSCTGKPAGSLAQRSSWLGAALAVVAILCLAL